MLNKDKDYHSYSSLLSFIDDGPQSLITEKKKSSKGLSKGKALDIYIYDDFDKKYYVSDVNIKLTSMENTLLGMVEKAIEGSLTEELLDSKEFIELCNDLAKEEDLFKGDRSNNKGLLPNERIDNIRTILKDKANAGNRTVIDGSFYIDVVNMANKLRSDEYVMEFFNNKNVDQYQNLNQIVRMFTHDDIKFKVVIDNIHINHEKKTLQINDLKYTSMKGSEFLRSFFKYRYDIQACLYTLALKYFKEEHVEFKDYEILEPSIITVNVFEKPTLYKINSSDVYSTWAGFEDNFGNYHKGIRDIVQEVKYHIEKEAFDYSMEYYQKKMVTVRMNRRSDGSSFGFISRFNRNTRDGFNIEAREMLDRLRDTPQPLYETKSARKKPINKFIKLSSGKIEKIDDNNFFDVIGDLKKQKTQVSQMARRGQLSYEKYRDQIAELNSTIDKVTNESK